ADSGPPVPQSPAGEKPRPVAADAPAAPPRRLVEEIIVTAQKTEQTERDVPISMTVLDDELLRREGVTDFHDAALYAPNTTVDNSATFPDIRVRGFGSPLSNKAFEQSVALAIDGITYGRAPYWQGPLFDLERVEVLRGPQGTLFGKNTTAGLFNVVTKKPTDELTGTVQLELGEMDHRRFEGGVGGPVLPGLVSFRISGLSDERDGIVGNTTAALVADANERMNGRDRKAVRFQLGFPDLLGASLVVGYEKVDLELLGTGWEFRRVTPNELAFFRDHDPATDVDPGNHIGSIDHFEIGERDIDTFVANASYDIGPWGLEAVVGHSVLDVVNHNDVDFTPAPMFWTDSTDSNPQTTFELRLDSPDLGGLLGLGRVSGFGLGTSRFTTGFFYERRRLADSRLAINLNAPVIAEFVATQSGGQPLPQNQELFDVITGQGVGLETSTGLFDQTGDAFAGFGHVTWSPLDRWALETGLRYSFETKKAHLARVFEQGTGVAFNALAGQEEFETDEERSEDAFTPQVSLRYDWTDEVNLFARWAKGFKAGGFNELNSNGRDGLEFDAEKVTAWETGSKMRLLGGAASLNLALFWNDVTDLQVFTLRPGDLVATVENVGEARARGVEVDGAWLPIDWLTVIGTLGFNDSEYLDFPFGECPMDSPEDPDGDGDPRCDLTGEPLYRAPKWAATLGHLARFPIVSIPGLRGVPFLSGAGVDLVAGFDAEYQDVHFTTRTSDPRSRQPKFFRFNADLGLDGAESGWTARVTVKNLTDEAVAIQSRDITLGAGTFAHILEEQRLVVGSLGWRF
ncbi:MAG: TonB-dependent receptor, partial [Candidatus Binatia bacterium]